MTNEDNIIQRMWEERVAQRQAVMNDYFAKEEERLKNTTSTNSFNEALENNPSFAAYLDSGDYAENMRRIQWAANMPDTVFRNTFLRKPTSISSKYKTGFEVPQVSQQTVPTNTVDYTERLKQLIETAQGIFNPPKTVVTPEQPNVAKKNPETLVPDVDIKTPVVTAQDQTPPQPAQVLPLPIDEMDEILSNSPYKELYTIDPENITLIKDDKGNPTGYKAIVKSTLPNELPSTLRFNTKDGKIVSVDRIATSKDTANQIYNDIEKERSNPQTIRTTTNSAVSFFKNHSTSSERVVVYTPKNINKLTEDINKANPSIFKALIDALASNPEFMNFYTQGRTSYKQNNGDPNIDTVFNPKDIEEKYTERGLNKEYFLYLASCMTFYLDIARQGNRFIIRKKGSPDWRLLDAKALIKENIKTFNKELQDSSVDEYGIPKFNG